MPSTTVIRRRRLRCAQVNALVAIIASVGRRFWRDGDGIARMEVDDLGRLWWVSEHDHRIYLHVATLRDHQLGGGTLRDLVRAFKDFVMTGQQPHPLVFGPWPKWVCGDGDRWGYGAAMEAVRTAARALGIIAAGERWWFVWVTDYPDEGSELVRATDERAAAKASGMLFEDGTLGGDLEDLTIQLATFDVVAERCLAAEGQRPFRTPLEAEPPTGDPA